jgi:chemotaxis protein MotB
MSRKGKHGASGSHHERWVLSYADFLTLLLAFFVVLFASANADRAKTRAVSEAIKAALSQGKHADLQAALQVIKDEQHPVASGSSLLDLVRSEKLLKQALKDEIQRSEVDIHMEPRGLIVSLKQGALFDSGDDGIKSSALPIIRKVANVLTQLSNQLRLEGHTDNVPIHNDRFRSNWELSSARSIAILHLLNQEYAIPMTRMAVSGYADVAPVASNTTDEGRMMNRRVDVVILSELAAHSEPVKGAF